MDVTTDAAAAVIAMRQEGLITRRQAMECGLTDRAIGVRVRAGRWQAIRRGVYVIAGAPPTERQTVLAACLAGGPAVMASHLTAARLWGLDLPPPSTIEMVGRHGALSGVTFHRSASLADADQGSLGALALTSPARTLVDCAGQVPADRLGRIVDDALRRGLVRLPALRACHQRIDTGPGRRPTVAMRSVLAERTTDDIGDSPPEADLVAAFARAGLPAPVFGHRVVLGRHKYRLDIAWPEHLVGVEYDSWEHHRTFTSFHGDRQRHRRLTAAGWRVVLVTSHTAIPELVADLSTLLQLSARFRTL
jgi:hypothetical protein